MSEKLDNRKLCSPERLERLKAMRDAKSKKAEERKKASEKVEHTVDQKKVEQKTEPNLEPILEEIVEEIEAPVVKRKPVKVPMDSYNFVQEDMIKKLVDQALPEEFRSEARKRKKWEMRKQEIKNEILQSLRPSTTQPSEAPKKNVQKSTLQYGDLFSSPYE